jgi:UDP-N-acetylmuramate dehydrogenase
MENKLIVDKLYDELVLNINGKIIKDEPLKKHTYFKIGGPADLFAEPENEEELRKVMNIAEKYGVNCFIMGNGTNLLISDDGFRGIIVKIGDKFSSIEKAGNILRAGAGTLLSVLAKKAAREGLTGLEFACGIPGCVGGAVYMNAGAYDGEMKDIVKKVKCIDKEGNFHILSNEEMEFSYRHSKIENSGMVVLEAEFELRQGDQEEIDSKIRDFNERRITKQPLNMPSAGSTFKRPKNGYASKLIEDAGLKGLRYRGAMVSDKHSGFIVNCDNATCEDVLELMRIVISAVDDKFGVKLEPEVKIVGTELWR